MIREIDILEPPENCTPLNKQMLEAGVKALLMSLENKPDDMDEILFFTVTCGHVWDAMAKATGEQKKISKLIQKMAHQHIWILARTQSF